MGGWWFGRTKHSSLKPCPAPHVCTQVCTHVYTHNYISVNTVYTDVHTDVYIDVYTHVHTQVPMFENAAPSFLVSLVQRLHATLYLPGDTICEAGALGEEMFFICEGRVAVIGITEHTHTEFVAHEMGPGDYFGEIALVIDDPLHSLYIGSMSAPCRPHRLI